MDETLKKQAYLKGINLKKEGLDAETIYARLESSGIPADLAEQVVRDLAEEQKKGRKSRNKERFKISAVVVAIGVLGTILTGIFVPEGLILPLGLILGGLFGMMKS